MCENSQEPTRALQQTVRHSMSWSARSRKNSEIVSPIDLAVLRLITSANLVGCWTGRSEGLAGGWPRPRRLIPVLPVTLNCFLSTADATTA